MSAQDRVAAAQTQVQLMVGNETMIALVKTKAIGLRSDAEGLARLARSCGNPEAILPSVKAAAGILVGLQALLEQQIQDAKELAELEAKAKAAKGTGKT